MHEGYPPPESPAFGAHCFLLSLGLEGLSLQQGSHLCRRAVLPVGHEGCGPRQEEFQQGAAEQGQFQSLGMDLRVGDTGKPLLAFALVRRAWQSSRHWGSGEQGCLSHCFTLNACTQGALVSLGLIYMRAAETQGFLEELKVAIGTNPACQMGTPWPSQKVFYSGREEQLSPALPHSW